MEEAEVDAEVVEDVQATSAAAGKINLWLAAKIAVRKIASRPVRPSIAPLNS